MPIASAAPPIAVVLVEPAGPLNVGSVARLCANFGVAQLRLVAPRCNPLGEEALRMAVHGRWVLEQARCHGSLAEALADCRRVVATSGRQEEAPLPLQPPRPALEWLLSPGPEPTGPDQTADPGSQAPAPGAPAPRALVFGREDQGLRNDELLQAGRLLRIGTGAAYASLNLSHAVAVVLHELHALQEPGQAAAAAPLGGATPSGALPPADPATRGALEATLADAEELLLEVGFLYPHTAAARMAKLRTLLQRAQISDGEVALLRGMVRQLRWASRRCSP
ncbi:MAG: RNA methyltransferase [Cyanobacteriota bacterium]|nr:RNA methyltransferase [Cyanobacteriota bacterium]